MSQKHVTVLEILRLFFFAGVLAVMSSGFAAGQEGTEDTCSGALAVDLNSSLRAYADKQGEPFLVKLEIPSAGILSVDVAVSGSAPAEPKLGLTSTGCGMPKAASEPVVLERSAAHLVLVAHEARPYLFRIASQDPSLPLRDFKLRTAFSSDTARPFSKGGENEEVIEIDADPLVYAGRDERRSLVSQLHELCRRGEVDDHGDTFMCATFLSLGQDMAGEIENGWGDDADVFQIVLGSSDGPKLWTLEIETTGPLDTFGGIYDRSGTRLDKGDSGGSGANFRIVRTLPPGTYFVRVEGRHGAEGSYALSVDATPW